MGLGKNGAQDMQPAAAKQEADGEEIEGDGGKGRRRKIFIAIALACLAGIVLYLLFPFVFPARAYLKKGDKLLKEKRYQEAIVLYKSALERNPRIAGAWTNLGFALDAVGRPGQAIKYLDKALSINPRLAKPWMHKGSALSGIGKLEDALRCYNEAIGIDAKYAGAWGNKSYLLRRMKRYDEARAALQKYIELEARDLKFDLTAGVVDEILRSLSPQIEEAVGLKFKSKVKYRLVAPHEIGEAARRRIAKQLKGMCPARDKKSLESHAQIQSEFYSEVISSMYEFMDGTLYVVPDNFQGNILLLKPKKKKIINLLTILLAHDLVHALDDQHHGLSRKILGVKSQEELDVLESVVEGHAVFVARPLSGRLGFSDEDFEVASGLSAGYLGEASPFDEAANQFVSSRYKKVYLGGEEFMKFVYEKEGTPGLAGLFNKPPSKVSFVLNPALYYEKKKKTLNLEDYIKLLQVAEELLPQKEGWSGRALKLSEGPMRKGLLAELSASEVEEAFRGFDEGFVVIYSRKNVASVSMALFKFRKAEDAASFLNAELKSIKSKWDKDRKHRGAALQILRDKSISIPLADRAFIKEVIISPTPSQRSYNFTVLATFGNFLCEFSSVNQPVDVEQVKGVISDLFTNLRKELRG